MATKEERALERAKYCETKLSPILQGMVAEMLKVLPDDPAEYMIKFLQLTPEDTTRMSTLSQVVADTPGASWTQEEMARMSTLSQFIADTPGAARGTVASILQMPPQERLSTLSQIIGDTPGASRATIASIMQLAPEARMSTLSQMIADTPGASRATIASILAMAPEERLSTLSQIIGDTPGASRATIASIVQLAPAERLSTLTQLINDTPGASRETINVLHMLTLTPEETTRLSTLSQVIADTPGAANLFGSLSPEELSRMSTLSQLIADTPGAGRATLNTIVSMAPNAAMALQPLDKTDELIRHNSRKSASNAVDAEQLRILTEKRAAEDAARLEREANRQSATDGVLKMQVALVDEHGVAPRQVPFAPDSAVLQRRLSDLSQAADDKEKKERDTNRKSVVDGVTAQQADLIAQHGDSMRKVPSVPNPAELQKRRSQVGLSD